MAEEEEGGKDWLGEEDVGLQLPWVRSSNVAWSWEEVGVDELSDLEGQTE